MWLILLALLGLHYEPTDYFVRNRTAIGIYDRQSNHKVISVAATGMGMDCLAIAVREGRADRGDTIRWINTAIDKTMAANKDNHGWLYHWTDPDGNPVYNKEVSSIDSALFYLGAYHAALRLNDPALITRVQGLIGSVDKSWMLTNGGNHPQKKTFSHGFHWHDGEAVFISQDWIEYSEGVLLYRLFDIDHVPPRTTLDLPLFTYYYPLCFYRDERMVDLLGQAIDRQIEDHGIFGITACDGPKGYTIFNPKIVSPLAIASCEPFFPEKAKKALERLKVAPTTPSIEMTSNWISDDHIGIDEAAYVLLTHSLP